MLSGAKNLSSCVSPSNGSGPSLRSGRLRENTLNVRLQLLIVDEQFFARSQVFYFHLRPFIPEQQCNPCPKLLGGLKLFADLFGCEWIIYAVPTVAKLLNLGKSIASALFLCDNNIDVHLPLVRDRILQFLTRGGCFTD